MNAALELVRVGLVGRPHGVRGEVKVIPQTDDPERLEEFDSVFVGLPEADARPLVVESIRYQHSKKGLTLLIKFAGYDAPEVALTLRGRVVMVRKEDWASDDDEILVTDLIGYEVISESGEVLGSVTNVLDMPAQTVYEITRQDGRISLLPGVEEFVKKIDSDGRRMVVAPIEGLFE